MVQAGLRAASPALASGLLLLPTLLPPVLPPMLAAGPREVGSRSRSTGAVQADQNAYILGPGDQLSLQILDPGAKDLGGTLEILNDGSASLALLGSVVLEGLTLNQAQAWLTSLYASQMYRPDLILRVVRPRPIQVSLVGEVENPGLYSLTSTETSQVTGSSEQATGLNLSGFPTAVTAIQKAGGLTLDANLAAVVLQRRMPGDSGNVRETTLDLISLLRTGDKSQNPFLFDGDTLVVGKALVPDREVMELAAANLSPQQISVNVIGEVVNPGRLQLSANTPVVQAVLAAGGPKTWRGKRSDVELVRINRNGSATRELFSIDYKQGVSNRRNPPLKDGDTVVVNRSTYAIATDALGAIATPVTGLVNIWALVRLIQDNNN